MAIYFFIFLLMAQVFRYEQKFNVVSVNSVEIQKGENEWRQAFIIEISNPKIVWYTKKQYYFHDELNEEAIDYLSSLKKDDKITLQTYLKI